MGKYAIWEPDAGDTEDDATVIPAEDALDAATAWADTSDYHSAEFFIAGGSPATLMVRDLSTGTQSKLVVSGEMSRHYTVTVLDDGEDGR